MAVTKKKTTNESVVVQNIQIRPVVRTSQDIEKWRNALQSAEAINPIRIPLYDLYEDMMLDGVLASLTEKRVLGVTKTQLQFVDATGKEVEEMSKLISTKQFRNLRKEIMLQKFYGITVLELTREADKLKVYSVPRKHIKPNLGKITWEQYGNDGIEYRVPPFSNYMIEVGDKDDLGLLVQAAQYVIYKRGGFGDWAHFAEIFGMPFREARYDGYNQQVRAQLEMALEQAGSAAYAILPTEAQITFHEAKSTQGSSQLYNDLRKACNEELSILILGQTETTTSSASSGYAQSETHANVEDGINESDREDELSILNEQVLPVLASLGFPVGNGEFVHVPAEEQMSLQARVDIALKVKKEHGIPVSDDYIYELTGIPKPDDYEAQKQQIQSAAADSRGAGKPDNSNAGKRHEDAGDMDNEEDEKPVKKKAKLAAQLTKLYAHNHRDHFTLAAGEEEALAKQLARMVRSMYKAKAMPEAIDDAVTKAFAQKLYSGVLPSFTSNIDYTTPDGEMLASLQKNIYQFSAAKNYHQLKELSNALVDNGALRSWSDFKAAAQQINDMQLNWLRSEYNLAVSSGQSAAQWVRIQETKEDLPLLQYSTVKDDRVRAEHAELDNVVRPADDSFWDTYYPPNGWGCRCDVIQLSSGQITPMDKIATPENVPPMMKVNLGKQGLAFPPKHPYYDGVPHNILKAGEKLVDGE